MLPPMGRRSNVRSEASGRGRIPGGTVGRMCSLVPRSRLLEAGDVVLRDRVVAARLLRRLAVSGVVRLGSREARRAKASRPVAEPVFAALDVRLAAPARIRRRGRGRSRDDPEKERGDRDRCKPPHAVTSFPRATLRAGSLIGFALPTTLGAVELSPT